MSDLKRLIDEKGISQNELARRIGVSKSSISRIISGAQVPKAPLAIKIADILGTDVRELCGAVETVEALPSKNLQPTCNQLATDLISRQAAVDIVQGYAEQLQGYIGMPNDSEVYAYARGLLLSIDRNIKALLSAQPELILCEDCKNSEHWYRDRRRCFLWSEDGVSVFDDGFCNYAERKTDEGD